MTPTPLPASHLYHSCAEQSLDFTTTAELAPLNGPVAQDRASDALHFATHMRHKGYNLYVTGSVGVGKHTLVMQLLKERSAQDPSPDDWCYVNNFLAPQQPHRLQLPPGTGRSLQRDMEMLIEELLGALPGAFQDDDYQGRAHEIRDAAHKRKEALFDTFKEACRQKGVAVMRSPGGYTLGPLINDKMIDTSEFAELPEAQQAALKRRVDEVNLELRQLLRSFPNIDEEARQRIKSLTREFTRYIVDPLANRIKNSYQSLPQVVRFVDAVHADILENAALFIKDEGNETPMARHRLAQSPEYQRYSVNVLVDNSSQQGAPVLYEGNPTYQNLIGRIEHQAHQGTLVTNFTLIKPGLLHRANGGYLVLSARQLLTTPFAWENLKRALYTQELKIESLEKRLSLATTTTLEPEPIPLNIKVVLYGDRELYHLLKAYDPEFSQLFKVHADFSESAPRTGDLTRQFARLIAGQIQRLQLLPFTRSGVARVIEESARRAEDQNKLSLHLGGLSDLCKEADYWARQASASQVEHRHVQKALNERVRQNDQFRELAHQQILDNLRLIRTDGVATGQANGLSVVQIGDYAFGQPTRISATARVGQGRLLDIERESELGGPIHSKGVLILGAFLAQRYAHDLPLSLSATLVFEQSYGQIEGDSASAAELCALLSAIASQPLRQSLAVTGSVNQHGQIQAIGGVNEKIEGFFSICARRGLTGHQGVIIPAANERHLMLQDDVVEAARNGRFHIYAVEHVDEILALLCDCAVGSDPNGNFPEGTLNHRVKAQLRTYERITRTRSTEAGNQSPDSSS